MVYREVMRVEINEVLRQWVSGAGCRCPARVGCQNGAPLRACGASVGANTCRGEAAFGDEGPTALLASLRTQAGRPRDDAWERCQAHRDRIRQLLAQGLRLSCASSCCAKACSFIRDAASIRSRRARLWPHRPDCADRRL
jgi:hypothetical protein